jgi:hypothetical protein
MADKAAVGLRPRRAGKVGRFIEIPRQLLPGSRSENRRQCIQSNLPNTESTAQPYLSCQPPEVGERDRSGKVHICCVLIVGRGRDKEGCCRYRHLRLLRCIITFIPTRV